MPPDRLSLPREVWQSILHHVQACLPEEACGFLGGRGSQVTLALPVKNSAHSSVRFHMDPEGQLQGMARLEDEGYEMLAIYHSHPMGPRGLSATDLAEAAYPESALVVLSSAAGTWEARAFTIGAGPPREIEVEVTGGEAGDPLGSLP